MVTMLDGIDREPLPPGGKGAVIGGPRCPSDIKTAPSDKLGAAIETTKTTGFSLPGYPAPRHPALGWPIDANVVVSKVCPTAKYSHYIRGLD